MMVQARIRGQPPGKAYIRTFANHRLCQPSCMAVGFCEQRNGSVNTFKIPADFFCGRPVVGRTQVQSRQPVLAARIHHHDGQVLLYLACQRIYPVKIRRTANRIGVLPQGAGSVEQQ